ncbi:MAG: hypothetical protein U9O94_01485 [Nanoarchaeota archaeon]|nr:hypothetical protein [Nanoarchaeota archaeon]
MRTLLQVLRGNRGSIEETDGDLLAKQAYEEQEAEKDGREPVDFIAKSKEEETKAEEETETPKDPNEPEIEVAGASEEEDPAKKESEEEETGEEDPKPEEEGEEEPETEESDDKKEEPDEDSKITKYAEKHGMTYTEAKEDIDKTNSIVEQFKGNPQEMARALRNKDREYDKLRNESEKETQSPVFQRLTEGQFRSIAAQKVEENPEKFLDAFKKKYPAKSEIMSDEAIIEEMIDREWGHYGNYATKEENEGLKKASALRDEMVSAIPKEDRRFLPEVKAFLGGVSDAIILQKGFDPSYILELAKGRKFDAEIKAAEERGFKRASEGKKILGVKHTDGKQPVTKKKAYSGDLNKEQRYRAAEMFPLDDGYSEEKAFEMFKDTYKKELKENPSFL